ncbi:MAG TPA: hypothetical protein VLA33_09365 [Gemmatimonadota bacterium]|nr:hypothetical protein [Gemmatimonadota bacterium]
MTRALLTLGALLAPTFGSAGPAAAQEAPRVAVRLSADTVRVGDPFTVGIVVVGAHDVRLPPLLDVAESWEQLEVARIESEDDGVRAYYRLVAWQAGALELPNLVMSTDGNLARQFRIELQGPVVRSVLPAGAGDEVELRGPRPPLDRGFPWLLALALLLVALVFAWWLWRRRASARTATEESAGDPGAAELARAALVALHARVEAGELGGAAVYDRLEEILREYLAGTREWPPGRPVRASSWTARGAMRELHRHAVLSRFAGVEAAATRLLTDVETSLDWLTKDAA